MAQRHRCTDLAQPLSWMFLVTRILFCLVLMEPKNRVSSYMSQLGAGRSPFISCLHSFISQNYKETNAFIYLFVALYNGSSLCLLENPCLYVLNLSPFSGHWDSGSLFNKAHVSSNTWPVCLRQDRAMEPNWPWNGSPLSVSECWDSSWGPPMPDKAMVST